MLNSYVILLLAIFGSTIRKFSNAILCAFSSFTTVEKSLQNSYLNICTTYLSFAEYNAKTELINDRLFTLNSINCSYTVSTNFQKLWILSSN